MVTYFVINEKERDAFEMLYQVPHGYYACPHFQNEEAAVGYVEMLPTNKRNQTIVEKWDGGVKEVIYHGSWYDTSIDDFYKE